VEIELDLKRIEQLGKERADENWEFRTFLKQLDMTSEEIDALVHQMTDEVSAQIDCTKCANCCKQIRPVLDKDDISQFAVGLKMAAAELKKNYLHLHEDSPSKYVFNKLPCPFLKDNLCSNYECRPKDCSSYCYASDGIGILPRKNKRVK